jgi:hypothetical protein
MVWVVELGRNTCVYIHTYTGLALRYTFFIYVLIRFFAILLFFYVSTYIFVFTPHMRTCCTFFQPFITDPGVSIKDYYYNNVIV